MSFCQDKSLSIGIKVLNEIDLDGGTFYPGGGGQIVYRMTKHSGLESGLYYSNQTMTFYFVTIGRETFHAAVAESWVRLPVLYRFDSKFLNFTVGPQLEYFLGWKNKHSNPSIIINNYARPSARFGLTNSLSKSIELSSKWLLEPEARLIFYPSNEYGTIGLNIALRKILF
jgi:hypothetical protein